MKNNNLMILLNTSVLLMMLGVGMSVAILPQKVLELSSDPSELGYLASYFAFSYVVLQIPIGIFSDKFGFKPFLSFGYLICVSAGGMYYIAENVQTIFWGRLLQGIGEAPIWALAPAVLSIAYPQNKGKVMGIYNAVLHIGLTFGPLLGILLLYFTDKNDLFSGRRW